MNRQDHFGTAPESSSLLPAVSSALNDDINALGSILPSHSREMCCTFDPNFLVSDAFDRYSDYSHIALRGKRICSSYGSASSRVPSVSSLHSPRESLFYHSESHALMSDAHEPIKSKVYHNGMGSSSNLLHDQAEKKIWSPLRQRLSIQTGYLGFGLSNTMLDFPQHGSYADMQTYHHQVSKQHDKFEDEEHMPPRLPAISGVLIEKPGKNLIRPIAFKPVHDTGSHFDITPVTQKNKQVLEQEVVGVYSQSQRGSLTEACLHQHPSLAISSRNAILSNSDQVEPASNSSDRSVSLSNEFLQQSDHGELSVASQLNNSLLSCNIHHLGASLQTMEVVGQTPSPSDSGVGELEAMLKEKDAEIFTLRQVMDRNERAIFQVYEEKKTSWVHELQDMKEGYENKLNLQQRRMQNIEQTLSQQVSKLQQEKQEMLGDMDAMRTEKEALTRQCASFQHQLHDLRMQLETTAAATSALSTGTVFTVSSASTKEQLQSYETTTELSDVKQQLQILHDELALKNKEIARLCTQLKCSQDDLENRNKELSDILLDMTSKTEEIKTLHMEVNKLSASKLVHCDSCTQTVHIDTQESLQDSRNTLPPAESAQTIVKLKDQVSELRKELVELKQEMTNSELDLERERSQWLEEKNKVIRYQKQLQLNYVQMQRKNTALEAEVEQLTLELEQRDIRLMSLSGDESVC